MRYIGLLLLCSCSLLLSAAGVTYPEPLPGPSWGVYIPSAINDSDGISDMTKKCHWYEKLDKDSNAVGGSWYTYIVIHNGTLITNNNDPVIWNGTDALIHLQADPDNPAELEVVLASTGQPPAAGSNYQVMRMVYVSPGSGVMPGTVTVGSPFYEAHRHKNERQRDVTLAGNYWIAANECSQSLWQGVVADRLPSSSGGASLDADLDVLLAADNITDTTNFKGYRQPLMYATYADAIEFCTQLTALVGTPARLPNEAEWEYASRGSRVTAFNTEIGYALGGPEWQLGTDTTPPVAIDEADWDDYFEKNTDYVNGRNNGTANPNIVSYANVFVNGSWENHVKIVEFFMSGDNGNPPNDPANPAIRAKTNFVGIAEVQANFDSRFKLWYKPVIYVANLTHSDGVTAYFTIDPDTKNDLTPAILELDDTSNRDRGPAHEYATNDTHLSHIVKGLYVGVDDAGNYSHDHEVIESFRLVTDGIMPQNVNPPLGAIVYHKLVQFDNKGIYIQSPLPDPDVYFQDSDQQIADVVSNLPLGNDNTTFRQDVDEQLAACIERAKSNALYRYVDWGRSSYQYRITLDYGGHLTDKQGIYALRNRLGIANMHGNVAEWCMPGNATSDAVRWDGVGTYDRAAAYDASHPYVVVRGGSWKSPAEKCRNAYRSAVKPDARRPHIGFRFIIPE